MQPEERDLRAKRFLKKHHLRKSSEFKSVFSQGNKVITPTLVFHVLKTDLCEPRLGLAVSRKVGNAVVRNKVKRRVREAFREKIASFPGGFDLVIYPRRGVLEKGFQDYLKSFEILIRKLGKSSRKHTTGQRPSQPENV